MCLFRYKKWMGGRAAYTGKVRNVCLMGSALAAPYALAGTIPRGLSDLKPELAARETLIAVKRVGNCFLKKISLAGQL